MKFAYLSILLLSVPAFADYSCMNQAKQVAENLMTANRESFVAGNSEIQFLKDKSSDEQRVFQIIGVDWAGAASTVGYVTTMNLPGCILTKFELVGAQ